MAAEEPKPSPSSSSSSSISPSPEKSLLSSYLGISFAVFLGFLPKSSISYISSLQSRNRILSLKLFQAEDHLKHLLSRRRDDAKANARVVELFAGHRNAWQHEDGRLRSRIEELERSGEELRDSVERLEKEVLERDEMIDLMEKKMEREMEEKEEEEECYGVRVSAEEELDRGMEACFFEGDEMAEIYAAAAAAATAAEKNGYRRDFLATVADSKRWTEMERLSESQEYDSHESMHHMKGFVARRESPWKADGDSSGVSCKLKLLEQELLNLENIDKGDLSKFPSLMRKQARRYQSLIGKMDDLCRRMQVTDPSEPTLSAEFRIQRQSEFLHEALRLQHRATETRQKLSSLQGEAAKRCAGSELAGVAKLIRKRSLDTIGNNFREVQRNMEIWLARIIGDVEGILAREGASRVKDYYVSRYAFVP